MDKRQDVIILSILKQSILLHRELTSRDDLFWAKTTGVFALIVEKYKKSRNFEKF